MAAQVQLDLPFLQVTDRSRLDDVTQIPADPSGAPPIQFVRVRRARRYILRVQPDGTLRVTVPRGGSRREAEAFVRENRRWVERERRRVRGEHPPPVWEDGTEVFLRGMPARISIEASASGWTIAFGGRRVPLAQLHAVRDAVEAELRAVARDELVPRLHELAGRHGLEVRRVNIRNQRTRWGSCARNGHIALNFRLVQMPDEVRDYVLVHELMHLRQQNHSRRFWRLVEAAYPRFREAERWLRTTGRSLF